MRLMSALKHESNQRLAAMRHTQSALLLRLVIITATTLVPCPAQQTGGVLVASRTVRVDTRGAQAFTFDFSNVTEVALFASATAATTDPFMCGPVNCTQFTVDEAVMDETLAPEVPGQGTAALLTLAACAFMTMRFRAPNVVAKYVKTVPWLAGVLVLLLTGAPLARLAPLTAAFRGKTARY